MKTNCDAAKPCPFCGGTKIAVIQGGTYRWRRAECQECEAMGGPVRIQTTGDGTKEDWESKAVVDALTVWNERKSHAEAAQDL